MKNILFVSGTFAVLFLYGCKVQVDYKLPPDAIILEQVLFVDEVKNGVPQTLLMPNGTTVTYKMPEKIFDGQLIKVRDVKGERPYFIKIKLRNNNGQKDK